MNRSVELNTVPANEHPLANDIDRTWDEDMGSSCSSLSLSSIFPKAMHDSFKSLGDEAFPAISEAYAAKSAAGVISASGNNKAPARALPLDGDYDRRNKSAVVDLEAAVAALRARVAESRSDLERRERTLRRRQRTWGNESNSALQEKLAGALDREIKASVSAEALRDQSESLRRKRAELDAETRVHRATVSDERERTKQLQGHLDRITEAARKRRAASMVQKKTGNSSSSPVRGTISTREGKVLSRMASNIFGRVI